MKPKNGKVSLVFHSAEVVLFRDTTPYEIVRPLGYSIFTLDDACEF